MGLCAVQASRDAHDYRFLWDRWSQPTMLMRLKIQADGTGVGRVKRPGGGAANRPPAVQNLGWIRLYHDEVY